jgi:hypothetical protein
MKKFKAAAAVTVEILKIYKPPPLRHFSYSRHAADGIRNFQIFEPPPLTPIINIRELKILLFQNLHKRFPVIPLNICGSFYLIHHNSKLILVII